MEVKNINNAENLIEEIVAKSIAEELNIVPGDMLLSINGKDVFDIIDYKYLISDEDILLKIKKNDGEIWEYSIEKDFDEDLGIIFTNPLINRAKTCRNKCIFCFIDQLPDNMRKSLYFKDDDSRLSFLQGNFITLTNMSDHEIDRIIHYRLSPINISVHTTNPLLRQKMLKNKRAGEIMDILRRFHEAELEVNCQIVLVPGINDGGELDRTLDDLSSLYPSVKSIAVVPIGVTKFRDNLENLKIFDSELSSKLIEDIEEKQAFYLKKLKSRFVFLSDEFYSLSKVKLPSYKEYENFPQLENGVGLMRLLEDEVISELEKIPRRDIYNKKIIVATGTLAYDFMVKLAKKIEEKFPGLNLSVKAIVNNYFGETITVSGLVTARDLINQLKGIENDGIIIPDSMLKKDEDIFLDNIRLSQVAQELSTRVLVSKVSGGDFIKLLKVEVSK